MSEATPQPEPFPPGFVEQVEAFFTSQAEEGVRQLVCYDRDENVVLVIALPVANAAQAAEDYRKAWRIWRAGGSVFRVRNEPRGGLPQNENRQSFGELPGFGLSG